MGCCSSSFATDLNASFDGLHGSTSRRGGSGLGSSKRSHSSRISSSASSGVSSQCTTPSRCSRASSQFPTLSPKTKSVKELLPGLDFEMLSICDDFGERPQSQPIENQRTGLDHSCGYFSESVSTGSSDGGDSTPSKSRLRHTRDTSEERAPSPAPSSADGNLEMEMYMMSRSQGLMPKTSSPLPPRRTDDATFDVADGPSPAVRHSASYNKWSHYLESTPAYMTHNLTNIPEAVAGHFCPSDFPAFIELECESNAAKRFKPNDYDERAAAQLAQVEVHQAPTPVLGLTQTISTDL